MPNFPKSWFCGGGSWRFGSDFCAKLFRFVSQIRFKFVSLPQHHDIKKKKTKSHSSSAGKSHMIYMQIYKFLSNFYQISTPNLTDVCTKSVQTLIKVLETVVAQWSQNLKDFVQIWFRFVRQYFRCLLQIWFEFVFRFSGIITSRERKYLRALPKLHIGFVRKSQD